MNDNFNSSKIKNYDNTLNNEESEYKKLLTVLKEIRETIALLEKTISR
ncbi:hypothetical protein [Prochlorococcus marinus]|uniref:Uncharacterized protein n=1 Tax=Prochlorococcus marinus str. GP2 TaxID=59925 RepID=A0A0A1ZIA1_PROMR|nr:hypothetical protein [Prochlorococcus marinus]KGF88271.1 hypothetical protein EU91_0202 [Prochlorococcus marinus str. GP2]